MWESFEFQMHLKGPALLQCIANESIMRRYSRPIVSKLCFRLSSFLFWKYALLFLAWHKKPLTFLASNDISSFCALPYSFTYQLSHIGLRPLSFPVNSNHPSKPSSDFTCSAKLLPVLPGGVRNPSWVFPTPYIHATFVLQVAFSKNPLFQCLNSPGYRYRHSACIDGLC